MQTNIGSEEQWREIGVRIALGGVLSKLIYGVSPADAAHFSLAVALLLRFVAAAACAIPGYRATRL
jgi:hypothetical protein